MPKKPPDLFNFWNELKRRKVVRASLVYLAVAFSILQAVEMIFPRLNFPDWTITFVMLLLFIVFILVVILTWVYDITPEGIKVTQDLQEGTKKGAMKSPVKEKGLKDVKGQAGTQTNEEDLQKRIYTLENQLKEVKTVTLKAALPVLAKTLAVPVLIIVLLILFVAYKRDIIDFIGIGKEKREMARTHNEKATNFINNGDYESARQEVELALASDPGYSLAWGNKAVISYREGDLDAAINQTLKAISLDPGNSNAPYNLAFALDDRKDYRQAVHWYKKAIQIDSTYNVDFVYMAASSALGRLYNSFDLPTVAIIVLSQACERFPHSDKIAYVYKNLGNSYLLQHQIDSALKYLELSDRLMPSQTETNLFLARAYEALGEINRSIEQWQNYIDLESDTAKINEAAKHRKELAVRQLQEIIK